MTLNEVLKTHAFTRGLADVHVAKLSTLAREVSFEENELILRAGQQSQNLYLLTSGSVCVEVTGRSYTVCIQALGPGEAFGWSSLLGHTDTLFQVRAREKAAALCLSGTALAEAFQDDPKLAADLLHRTLRVVAGRVVATEARLGELCGVRAPVKSEPAPAR